MANNLRAYCEFKSYAGKSWKVEIYQDGYTGDEIQFDMDSKGFELSYDAEDMVRDAAVLGSKVTIPVNVNSTEIEDFVDDLIDAYENDFWVLIKLKNEVQWRGNVLMDLGDQADEWPYTFEITATDGLAKLQDIPFKDTDGSLFTEYSSLKEIVIDVLTKLQTTDTYLGTDAFLQIAVNWYEDSMPSESYLRDPFEFTRVRNEVFIDMSVTGEGGEAVPMSCYEVLEQIMSRFNARLFLTAGHWHIYQINNIVSTTCWSSTYMKSGTVLSRDASTSCQNTDMSRMAGGNISYFAPLREVSQVYNYRSSSAFGTLNLLPSQQSYTPAVSFTAQHGSDDTFLFTGIINEEMKYIIQSTYYHRAIWRMELEIGGWYYTKVNGEGIWVNYPAYYYITGELRTETIYEYTWNISIQTDTIPVMAGTSGSFEFKLSHWEDQHGNIITLPSQFEHTYKCINFSLVMVPEGVSPETGDEKFKAISTTDGSTPVGCSPTHELKRMLLGDGPEFGIGKLQVYTSGGTWEDSTELWRYALSGLDKINISQLACMEYLAGQRKPIMKYQGIFHGQYSINKTIRFSFRGMYENYVFLSGKFNAVTDIWDGVWCRITLDRTNIDNSSYTAIKANVKTMLPDSSFMAVAMGQLHEKTAEAFGTNIRLALDGSTIKLQQKIGLEWKDTGTEWGALDS